LVNLYDYFLSGSGAGVGNSTAQVNKSVEVELNVANATSIAPLTVISALKVTTTTDANGFWSVWVVPNTNINPANTLYTVKVDGQIEYKVTLGAAGPYQSTAVGVIVDAPTALAAATSSVASLTINPGPLTVQGTSSLQGAVTVTTGGLTVSVGGLTVSASTITMGQSISQLVPGATSFSIRDTANVNDNLLITNAGAATIRAGLTVTAGGAIVSAGGVTVTGASTITGTLGGLTGLTVVSGGATITAGGLTVTGATAITGNLTHTTAYKARAYQTAVQAALVNATTTDIILDTKTPAPSGFDPNGNFSLVSPGQYTAPVTGFYLVIGQVGFASATTPIAVYVAKNAVTMSQATQGANASGGGMGQRLQVATIENLTVGDVLKLQARQDSGGALAPQAGATITFLEVHYLSGPT
jgi:hypothetical protein